MIILTGLAVFLVLFASGAGLSVALLGHRWRGLWPLTAPVVGFCALVVAAELPSSLAGARTWGAPVLGAVLALNGWLVWRRRHELRTNQWPWLLVALPMLVIGLLPLLGEGALTTVSVDNHDYFFYLALEQQLIEGSHLAPPVVGLSLIDRMADLLRFGGWRIGVCVVTAMLGGASGLAPHQLDGLVWSAMYATVAPAAVATHTLLVPRASLPSRLFVCVAAAFSGPALMLMRMSFASHAVTMSLFPLTWVVMWRGLGQRARGLRVLGALLLAGAVSTLADATPLLAALGLAALGQRLVTAQPEARGRVLRRAGWGLAALAFVPLALYRIYLSLVSLTVTGYHGPRTDETAASPSQLAPALMGFGQASFEQIADLSWWLAAPAFVAAAAGFLLLTQVHRLRRPQGSAVGSLVLVVLLLFLVMHLMETVYPRYKFALSLHLFAVPVLAALFDRLAARWRRPAIGFGLLVLAVQLITVMPKALAEEGHEIGIRGRHLQVVERVVALSPDVVHLRGTAASPRGLADEQALVYLLRVQGIDVRTLPHPHSYLRIKQRPDEGWRRFDPGKGKQLVIVSGGDQWPLGGKPLHADENFAVYDASEAAPFHLSFPAGWYPPEQEPGRAFRWADRAATIVYEAPSPGWCLSLEARTAARADSAHLVVESENGASVGARIFEVGEHWKRLTLPAASVDEPVALSLRFVGEGVRLPDDGRDLLYAVGNPRLVGPEECGAELAAVAR